MPIHSSVHLVTSAPFFFIAINSFHYFNFECFIIDILQL